MDDEFIDFKKGFLNMPKGHLIILLVVSFLVSGFALGYVVGGYTTHVGWSKYTQLREQYINETCICMKDTPAEEKYPELIKNPEIIK